MKRPCSSEDTSGQRFPRGFPIPLEPEAMTQNSLGPTISRPAGSFFKASISLSPVIRISAPASSAEPYHHQIVAVAKR